MKKKHDINIVCVEFLPLHHTKSDRSWAEQVICLLKIQRHIHKHSPLYWQCSTEDVIYIFVEFVCLLLYKTCSLLTSSCLSAEFTVCTGDETDAGVQERRREKTRTSTVDYNTYNPSDRVPVNRNLFRSLSLCSSFVFVFVFISYSLRSVQFLTRITVLLLLLPLLLLLFACVVVIVEFVYWIKESATHWLYILHGWCEPSSTWSTVWIEVPARLEQNARVVRAPSKKYINHWSLV